MLKNKSSLAVKLFIIVWCVLAVHIALKLTFNYWQPYVIPNEQLQVISDFIDDNSIIKMVLNKLLWFVGTYFMILASIQQWKFKNKYIIIILIIFGILSALDDFTPFDAIIDIIITILTLIILPLLIDKTKWITILITFTLNYIFLLLSLWLEQFMSVDEMNYFIRILFQFDYYIMLILNYFVFNLIERKNDNG